MSMNEELQSANEELETSKEELQSLNEELTTVNGQLQEKLLELEAHHQRHDQLAGQQRYRRGVSRLRLAHQAVYAADRKAAQPASSDVGTAASRFLTDVYGWLACWRSAVGAGQRSPGEKEVWSDPLPVAGTATARRAARRCHLRRIPSVPAGEQQSKASSSRCWTSPNAWRRESQMRRLATVLRDSNDA